MDLKYSSEYAEINADSTKHTNVGSRATIFKITVSLISNVPRDTNGCATVGNTRTKITNVAGLVTTSQPQLVILSVDSDVLLVPLGQLLNGSFNVLDSSRLTHLLGGVVGVATSTVPITSQRLGVEGDLDTPLFSYTDEKVTSHPKVVTHGDTLARTNLELPLGWHDFSVDAADVDARV